MNEPTTQPMSQMRIWNPDKDGVDKPLRWRRPGHVLVDAKWGDLFYPAHTDERISSVWSVMAATPAYTYHVVTAHPWRSAKLLNDNDWCSEMLTRESVIRWQKSFDHPHGYLPAMAPANIWLGIQAGTQETVAAYLPPLLNTRAAVRFLSTRPTGHIDLAKYLLPQPVWGPEYTEPTSPAGIKVQDLTDRPALDWVIAGADQGLGGADLARRYPLHIDVIRSLRDQCVAAKVPFMFTGWGEHLCATVFDDASFAGGRAYHDPVHGPGSTTSIWVRTPGPSGTMRNGGGHPMRPGERTKGGDVMLDDNTIAVKVGRAAAGRRIDGVTWDQIPAQLFDLKDEATTDE